MLKKKFELSLLTFSSAKSRINSEASEIRLKSVNDSKEAAMALRK